MVMGLRVMAWDGEGRRSNRQTQGSNGQKAGEAGAGKQVMVGFLEGKGGLSIRHRGHSLGHLLAGSSGASASRRDR
jgi:hypothetical protein